MVVAFGVVMRSEGQVSHTKTIGEGDHPVYVAKDYGTFVLALASCAIVAVTFDL